MKLNQLLEVIISIVLILLLNDGLVLTVRSEVICPLASDYSPCDCREPTLVIDQGTIVLDCSRRNLDDSAVSKILDTFLNTIGVSPLGYASFTGNRLTKVPDQIRQFPQLFAVALDYNNIQSIPTGAFNFVRTLKYLYLSVNQMTTIAPGAFGGNGYGNGSIVTVYNNTLTRFESGVFQSVLEKMAPFGYPQSYVVVNLNPIDCATDPCHLAWLLRDNRQLLSAISGGICADGTLFADLNQSLFTNCPSTNDA